jgi:hypothetical protein
MHSLSQNHVRSGVGWRSNSHSGGMEAESATFGRNCAKEEEVKKHHASSGRNVRRPSCQWSAGFSHIRSVGMVASSPTTDSLVVGLPKFPAPCSSAVMVRSLLIWLPCMSLFTRWRRMCACSKACNLFNKERRASQFADDSAMAVPCTNMLGSVRYDYEGFVITHAGKVKR